MKKYDVCVIGDLVVDYVVKIPRLPLLPNETIIATEAFPVPGGASNFLITAARLGLRTCAIDVIGADEWGQTLINELRSEGIDTKGVKILDDGKTTHVIVLVDNEGNHSFIGILGSRLRPDIIDEELITYSKYLYVSCYSMLTPAEVDSTLKAIKIAYKAHTKIFFDPGPLHNVVPNEVLRNVISSSNIISLNEFEAQAITRTSNLEDSAKKLLSMGAEIVVIKMGAKGALLAYNDTLEMIPTLNVKVVDTSGAGDSFNAGLLFGLLRGLSPKESVIVANAVGTAKVQKLGTGKNMPTVREVKQMLIAMGRENLASKLFP